MYRIEAEQKMNGFVARLFRARMDRGLTQQDVADKIGIVRQIISRSEVGRDYPTLSNFMQWADALGFRLELVKKEKP